jgi:hypothetical protein
MLPIYPTQKEILEEIPHDQTIQIATPILQEWKKKHYAKKWRKTTNIQKQIAITLLLHSIWEKLGRKEQLTVTWDPKRKQWFYIPNQNLINGSPSNPSII